MFKKLFCKHKWKVHNRDKILVKELDTDTKYWYTPIWYQYYETTEILICEECGKIKKIKY